MPQKFPKSAREYAVLSQNAKLWKLHHLQNCKSDQAEI